MRNTRNAFHLAIPVHDLDHAYDFYVTGLGCHLARRYPDRITVDFFGDQVVCHLTEPTDPEPDNPTAADDTPVELSLYPRHFGVTFHDRADFDDLLRLVELRKLPVFAAASTRFGGLVEEHTTMVLRDPSDNLLEFKHYLDPRMML